MFDFFFCKQKTANEMRMRDWSSVVCSSDLFCRPNRQPDTAHYRSWEIAGASHGPAELLKIIRGKEDRDGVGSRWHAFDEASAVSWQPTSDAAIQHVQIGRAHV